MSFDSQCTEWEKLGNMSSNVVWRLMHSLISQLTDCHHLAINVDQLPGYVCGVSRKSLKVSRKYIVILSLSFYTFPIDLLCHLESSECCVTGIFFPFVCCCSDS